MRSRSCISLMIVFLTAVPVEMSVAQSSDAALERRIERLEQDLNVLQRDYFRGPGGAGGFIEASPPVFDSPGQAANVEIRISSLENEIRRLTGMIEELGHRIGLLELASTKLIEDVEFRLREIEGRSGLVSADDGSASGAGPDGLTSGAVPGITLEPEDGISAGVDNTQQAALGSTADERYNSARRMIAQGRYQEAESALQGLLAAFPDSELAPNAQYWLGETYYVRQLYEEAAAAFVTGLQDYGSSGKGPDYMLKLGMALIGMGNSDDGCAALAALPGRYRNAPEQIMERARDTRQRFQCP